MLEWTAVLVTHCRPVSLVEAGRLSCVVGGFGCRDGYTAHPTSPAPHIKDVARAAKRIADAAIDLARYVAP